MQLGWGTSNDLCVWKTCLSGWHLSDKWQTIPDHQPSRHEPCRKATLISSSHTNVLVYYSSPHLTDYMKASMVQALLFTHPGRDCWYAVHCTLSCEAPGSIPSTELYYCTIANCSLAYEAENMHADCKKNYFSKFAKVTLMKDHQQTVYNGIKEISLCIYFISLTKSNLIDVFKTLI